MVFSMMKEHNFVKHAIKPVESVAMPVTQIDAYNVIMEAI